MFRGCGLHRRDVFGLAGGFAAALALSRLQPAKAQIAPPVAGGALPARGEFVVRGGHVLTMDANLGDLPGGDVHVRDGAIVAVGANVNAPNAQVIDGRDMIVMPGFVDTHWHLWGTALRLIVRADDPQEGYFPTSLRVGRFCTPQDSYIGVRLGVAEGLLSGITTVHDFVRYRSDLRLLCSQASQRKNVSIATDTKYRRRRSKAGDAAGSAIGQGARCRRHLGEVHSRYIRLDNKRRNGQCQCNVSPRRCRGCSKLLTIVTTRPSCRLLGASPGSCPSIGRQRGRSDFCNKNRSYPDSCTAQHRRQHGRRLRFALHPLVT